MSKLNRTPRDATGRFRAGHRCLAALIWVYAVTALARILITVAAVSLSLAGVVIVGASGQRIMITLGLSAGLDQDNLEAVAGCVEAPLARGVVDDGDTAELTFRPGSDGCSRHPSGPT
jgi:hypothetical protein